MLWFWGVYAVVAVAYILLVRRWQRPYSAAYRAKYGESPSLSLVYKRDADPSIERMRLKVLALYLGAIALVLVMLYLYRAI